MSIIKLTATSSSTGEPILSRERVTKASDSDTRKYSAKLYGMLSLALTFADWLLVFILFLDAVWCTGVAVCCAEKEVVNRKGGSPSLIKPGMMWSEWQSRRMSPTLQTYFHNQEAQQETYAEDWTGTFRIDQYSGTNSCCFIFRRLP